jgi:hypothetical protein
MTIPRYVPIRLILHVKILIPSECQIIAFRENTAKAPLRQQGTGTVMTAPSRIDLVYHPENVGHTSKKGYCALKEY